MARKKTQYAVSREEQPLWALFSWTEVLALCAIVGVLLLPLLNKAYHVDDPLFVWTAKHVLQEPLNFYGFYTNWGRSQTYMYEIMQNPPLVSYYLAPIGAAFGWGERVMHLAMLVPTLLTCAGLYMAARRFCSRPALAAGLVLVSPGFMVSSSQVMSDIPMIGWWAWALYFWMRGLDEDKLHFSITGALCIGLGALTKYFAFSLAPLLVVYTLMAAPARRNHLWALVIPFVILIGFEFLCNRLYGVGLLSDATRFASQHRAQYQADPFAKAQTAIVFSGGTLASLTLLLPWLWNRKHLMVWTGVFAAVLLLNVLLPDSRVMKTVYQINYSNPGSDIVTETGFQPTLLHHVQWALWTVGGLQFIALALLDLYRRRDPASVMFSLWIAGTLFFVVMINHFVNARVVLPMGLAVALLAIRRMEDLAAAIVPAKEQARQITWRAGDWRIPSPWLHRGTVAVAAATLVLSILLNYLDYRLAGSARTAATEIMDEAAGRTVWFSGHSGWQYYMEARGANPIDQQRSTPMPGDQYVLPSNNWQPVPVNPARVREFHHKVFPVPRWGTTSHYEVYAGFYSDGAGPLPFYLGPVPEEIYLVVDLGEIREL
jgi:4-amino-4-deoxy-L-arabinose transferase-like glycosyltransferase